jgi:hypothetical protein
MRFRKLRIAWSVMCAIATVLLIVLWVRSYWWLDGISSPMSNGLGFQVYSTDGRIVCSEGSPAGPTQSKPWELNIGYEHTLEGAEASNSVFRGFDILREPCVTRIRGPHWFPVLIFAALTAAPWLRGSRKFSLRTLLIATTLVAVVLGLVAWAARQ